ncbi:MAG: hypothetical protein NBV65_03755 [Burkholderiaceae bacterium]|nr:hypothetical protein [Burkholderiaceae bacterium]
MPGPSVNRIKQTADEAVQVINHARKYGQSLEVTKDGNIAVKQPMPHVFVVWARKLFGSSVHSTADDIRTLKSVLATKMKIDLVIASKHSNEQLRTSLETIKKIDSGGQLNELCDAWTGIKNTVQLTNSQMRDNLRLLDEQKRHLQTSSDNASTVVHHGTAAPAPAPAPAPATAATAPSSAPPVRRRIDEANQALPAAMPKITRLGETVKCTLKVPESAQLKIFDSWRDWETHAKPQSSSDPDPFVGLSEQFFKYAERMTYVFEGSDGFPVECERNSESVAIALKQAAGKNAMRQLILSHLLDQGIVLDMLKLLLTAHPRADGNACILAGPVDRPEFSQQVFRTTAHDNGDIDIEYLIMNKCTKLARSDGTAMSINSSSTFDGPISPENASTVQSMKIRLLNADLNRGQLLPQILKPLQLDLKIELPVTEPDE